MPENKGVNALLKEVIYTKEELEERLVYWQEKLRLRDWMIQINIKREQDFTTSDSNAEILYNLSNKSAFISMMDPVDFDDLLPQDMEWLLIHELLHLHFAPMDNNRNRTSIEQGIESITYGLVQLERQ